MKKSISIFVVFIMLCTIATSSISASPNGYSSENKILPELKERLKNMKSEDTVRIYVVVNDVDSTSVMKKFSEEYPSEYEAYMYAINDMNDVEDGFLFTDEIRAHERKDGYTDSIEYVELLQRAIELKRSEYRKAYHELSYNTLYKYCNEKDIIFVSEYSPMSIIDIKLSEIDKLVRDENIYSLDIFEDYESCIEMSMTMVNSISRATTVKNYGYTGSGVKIGQIEHNVPAIHSDLTSSIIFKSPPVNDNSVTHDQDISHATLVARILVGDEFGVAPDAMLYSVGYSDTIEFYSRVETLLNLGVNIINMSSGFTQNAGMYDTMCKWIDHIAVQHDVHFVKSAGNKSYYVDETDDRYITGPGMAYNVITVGCYDGNNTTIHSDDTLYSKSCRLEAALQNRAEKPNVVALGEYILVDGQVRRGTSFAAPQVAGVIAQLCSYKTTLKTKQSMMGAILAASSARKLEIITGEKGELFYDSDSVDGSCWQISKSQGAGKLDAYWAYTIPRDSHCWSATIQRASFPYTKQVTITPSSSNTLTRIAIFWLKRNSISTSPHGVSYSTNQIDFTNLDIMIFDPNNHSVAFSMTEYSNYEIVQFEPEATGTYTIKIYINSLDNSDSEKEIVGIAMW